MGSKCYLGASKWVMLAPYGLDEANSGTKMIPRCIQEGLGGRQELPMAPEASKGTPESAQG